jgi:hypothetical protein
LRAPSSTAPTIKVWPAAIVVRTERFESALATGGEVDGTPTVTPSLRTPPQLFLMRTE